MRSSRSRTGERAILYTRVSTDEQAERGYSLRYQEERLQHYCKLNGITVVDHYQDDASAKTFDRPAFIKLLKYVQSHRREIDQVLFIKWDRFSRNAEAAYVMIRTLRDLGVEVQAIEQPIDLSVPENQFMLAFYLTAPQVENDRRSLNTKAGMRRAMKEGRWVSSPPKGYKKGRDALDKPLMQPGEAAVFVHEAFTEIAKGCYTLDEVRLRLRKKGFKCSKNQFGLLLRNPVYMGKIRIPAWQDEEEQLVDGLHEPLISEEVFHQVQAVLEGRKGRRRGKPTRRHEALPLRGHLLCSQCGGNLTGSVSKGNGGSYYYYHCQKGCKERFRAEDANAEFLRYLRSLSIAPEVAQLHLAIMNDIFKERDGDRSKENTRVGRALAQINERLLRADEMYVEGRLEADSHARLKQNYLDQRKDLEEQQRKIADFGSHYDEYLRYGFSLVSNLPGYYKKADLRGKHEIVGSIFPEKLTYADGTYRTSRYNEVIALLGGKRADLVTQKEGLTTEIGDQSYEVALLGFEPRTS